MIIDKNNYGYDIVLFAARRVWEEGGLGSFRGPNIVEVHLYLSRFIFFKIRFNSKIIIREREREVLILSTINTDHQGLLAVCTSANQMRSAVVAAVYRL